MGGGFGKKRVASFASAYFGPELELRVRLFNVLAMGGTAISLCMAVLSILNNTGAVNTAANIAVSALSYALLAYSRRSGRYQVCYVITVVVIFIIFFPVLFFSSGGYRSGMPAFFVFAVAFTVFMLEGRKAVFFSVVELMAYATICVVAHLRPETVNWFATDLEQVTDVLVAFITVSVVLGVSMFMHFRLYNEQQRKLNEQNDILARASRAKTEFISNTSHEMRTPLTVISLNIQMVMDLLSGIGEAAGDVNSQALLAKAQGEIMRLSRIVGGMLTLASMSESTDREAVDLSALLNSDAEMLRLSLSKRGNSLETDIEGGLKVFGNADLLAQVVANLLQNSAAHTENGIIALRAARAGNEITVAVRDTGTGIAPELLPRVFERGVTDGGTGFGLYLCKTVVESSGGRIWIDSEPGKGTTAAFALPAFEGQVASC